MLKSITANLMVENVEKTIKFYEEVLGFSVIESVPSEEGTLQFSIVYKDEAIIMFQEKENFIKEYPILDTESVKPSISLFITVDNLDEIYSDISSKTELLIDKHKTPYGMHEFAIADNNGYVITIAEKVE